MRADQLFLQLLVFDHDYIYIHNVYVHIYLYSWIYRTPWIYLNTRLKIQ